MKNIGSVIDKEFNSACKEQLGKSFGEGMSMVPKAGLTKKVSSVEAKKKSVKKRENFKKMYKIPGKNNDVNHHQAQRKSFAARKRQRMLECFETIDEAKRRVKNAPKQQKRSHILSTVDGNLEQPMLDVNDWKTLNWSEKAKEYQMRRKGASVPPPNAGQVLKEYLKS